MIRRINILFTSMKEKESQVKTILKDVEGRKDMGSTTKILFFKGPPSPDLPAAGDLLGHYRKIRHY